MKSLLALLKLCFSKQSYICLTREEYDAMQLEQYEAETRAHMLEVAIQRIYSSDTPLMLEEAEFLASHGGDYECKLILEAMDA